MIELINCWKIDFSNKRIKFPFKFNNETFDNPSNAFESISDINDDDKSISPIFSLFWNTNGCICHYEIN